MKESIHRSACAVLVLLALTLTGCPWKYLAVQIVDFETNEVQGLQLWRAEDPASESLIEAGRVLFGDCYFENGTERMEYTMVNSQNEPVAYTHPAVMVRGEDGESAVLHFIFSQWVEPPGWIRASSFNVVGESELSEDAVFL
jgi:hypothetical protein